MISTQWKPRECPACGRLASDFDVLGFACEHARCPLFDELIDYEPTDYDTIEERENR